MGDIVSANQRDADNYPPSVCANFEEADIVFADIVSAISDYPPIANSPTWNNTLKAFLKAYILHTKIHLLIMT
jgi:hypothetical protein